VSVEQFVDDVIARLQPLPGGADDDDGLRTIVAGLQRDGFSVDDAVAYCRCLEELSPDLDEEVALTRMARLRARYVKG